MKMRVCLDIETNAIENPDKLWCIVTKDIETNNVKHYLQGDIQQFLLDARDYTLVIGHNIIGYDLHHLNRLIGWQYDGEVCDTLILSQLLKYEIEGGHSLEAWGTRLKRPKQEFTDFSKYSVEMLTYCVNDVEVNHELYTFLRNKLKPAIFDRAIKVEHEVAKILRKTKEDGFPFDMEKMRALRTEVEDRIKVLDEAIITAFPPKLYSLGEYIPRLTKHGTISRSNLRWYEGDDFSVFEPDAPFCRIGVEYFNPGSVKQIVQRLTDNGWWDPTDRTDGYVKAQRARDRAKTAKLDKYGYKVNETNLATLRDNAPESAKLLVERLALGSRLSTFDQWERAYNPKTQAVHGTIHGIGTWTHRCSHTNPNLANIAAKKSIKYKEPVLAAKITKLGGQMRDLFRCSSVVDGDANSDDSDRPTHWLVGTDAEGIQLRLFSHYANDEALIKANVEGDKTLGTDIHSLNRLALGPVCKTRDDAKTWIYAWTKAGIQNSVNSGELLRGQS